VEILVKGNRFADSQPLHQDEARLVGAVQRISGHGGDPVVQLQTNFGGGKTHSMLPHYHLSSAPAVTDLAGIDAMLQGRDTKKLTSGFETE